MEFFDTHAHYDDEKFDLDREEIIKQIYLENITRVITAGYSIKSSRKAIKLANKIDYMYATCRSFSK